MATNQSREKEQQQVREETKPTCSMKIAQSHTVTVCVPLGTFYRRQVIRHRCGKGGHVARECADPFPKTGFGQGGGPKSRKRGKLA